MIVIGMENSLWIRSSWMTPRRVANGAQTFLLDIEPINNLGRILAIMANQAPAARISFRYLTNSDAVFLNDLRCFATQFQIIQTQIALIVIFDKDILLRQFNPMT